MTTREILDIAVFAVLSLGCFGLEVATFWDVAAAHVL
jgi:hypothetical protein